MDLSTAGSMSGSRLVKIVGISMAVFVAASAVAAVGYAEWMWAFVFAGLVLPPVVVVLTLVAALVARLSRS